MGRLYGGIGDHFSGGGVSSIGMAVRCEGLEEVPFPT